MSTTSQSTSVNPTTDHWRELKAAHKAANTALAAWADARNTMLDVLVGRDWVGKPANHEERLRLLINLIDNDIALTELISRGSATVPTVMGANPVWQTQRELDAARAHFIRAVQPLKELLPASSLDNPSFTGATAAHRAASDAMRSFSVVLDQSPGLSR